MEFPKVVPIQHAYTLGDRFYVRECYPRYYDMVSKHFIDGKKVVTITGSPGETAASTALVWGIRLTIV